VKDDKACPAITVPHPAGRINARDPELIPVPLEDRRNKSVEETLFSKKNGGFSRSWSDSWSDGRKKEVDEVWIRET